MNKRLISLITATTLTASLLAQPALSPMAAVNTPAQMEYLDRGTVAVKSGNGVYLSWRLLGTENYDTTFDVYRGTTKVATALDATNYTDSTVGSSYTVVPSGQAPSSGKAVTVNANQYITIPLDRPESGISLDDGSTYTYSPNDVTPADVDGDGEYELILKWEPSNSFDSGKAARHSGNVFIDAYELDGTKLWRIDLGVNINAGQHFTQIAAYDFDFDCKAELAMKTAPGSIDGTGRYVSDASDIQAIQNTDNTADYRQSDGRVLSGDEFYTVFQGDTGAALDTIYYPHPRGTISEWGDNWGNRSERYLCAVAYLDGQMPSMITWRGYYAKTTATAYNLVNKKLVQIADFNTDNGYQKYAGNGNHNLTVGDVDDDGCDEIICGSLALDNDLTPLWCSERGHGDALHLADYDPSHKGMEYFSVHEASPYGMTLYDAATGEELFHKDGEGDTGAGMMANVGYEEGYFELWGAGSYYSRGGSNIREGDYSPASYRFRIFWNGDTYDELLDGTGSKDSGSNPKIDSKSGRIFNMENALTNNGSKNNPCLQADLFGDWREEIVVRSNDNESLLVYTTTIPTTHKLYTLMHDSSYRMQVACQNAGYNQPPHIGYYIDEENSQYDCRKYAAYVKTVHNGEVAYRTANLPDEKTYEEAPEKTPVPFHDFKVKNGVITDYGGSGGLVEIPDTLNGEVITGIGAGLFRNNTDVTDIILPESVVSIGNNAFSGCTTLKTIRMPGVTNFGNNVFGNCSSLEEVEFAEGTIEIPSGTFSGCTSLKRVTIPRRVYSLSVSDFSSCDDVYGYESSCAQKVCADKFRVIEEMTPIEENGWRIDPQGTLCGYTGDETVLEIPPEIAGISVNRIAAIAFDGNDKIESIKIPDGVTTIDNGVEQLRVTKYRCGAFYNCTALKHIEIPQTLKDIGINAFRLCSSLEEITLPDEMDNIGNYAFYSCSSLKQIALPENTDNIGTYLFYGCSALESIDIPNGWSKLPDYTFANCTSLKSVSLPEYIETAGVHLFDNCSELESITIPQTWSIMPDYMFYRCNSLTSVLLPLSVERAGTHLFDGCTALESITIPEGWTTIPDYMFRGCTSLTNIKLPQNVEQLGEGILAGCTAIKGIEITDNITKIGSGAFSETGIENIAIPDSVTDIGSGLFYKCTELNSVSLSRNITKIPAGIFYGCTSLEELEIPEGVTEICTPARKAGGTGGVQPIGSTDNAFEKCTALKKLVIPQSVETIAANTFKGCDNLVIYGYNGTRAQTYAEENAIPFVPIGGETPEPTETPEPYAYPYEVLIHSLDMQYVTISGECYEKKENAVIIFAVYSDDGNLISAQIKNLNTDGEGDFTAAFPYIDGQFKVFIWDINTQEPYSEVYSNV